VKRLELVPPVEADAAVMPSRRMPDGSVVFGLVEDRPPPYLSLVLIERDGRAVHPDAVDDSG